jgi:hypothetical protein
MSKFYRTACFEEIGGFVPQVMWDGIDCHRCRMLGWTARSFDDPELRFLHLRAMGSSQDGLWVGRRRHGAGGGSWARGSCMTASALFRATRPPLLEGGLAMAGVRRQHGREEAALSRPQVPLLLAALSARIVDPGRRRATERAELGR